MNPVNDAHQWSVMLADTAPPTDDTLRDLASKGFIFDTKWDGVRALAIINNGVLTLRNRKGDDFTFRYPELVSAVADQFAGRSLVLDCEVLIFDPQTGVPKFTLTSKRAFGPGRVADIARMAKSLPATLVAFDYLADNIDDVRGLPQHARLSILDAVVPISGWRVVRSIRSDDGVKLMEVVKAKSLEGLIAKKFGATYRAGRRSDWLKIKPTHTITCLVTGWEPGEGWRSETFGALRIKVIGADGSLIDVGKVGSGFTVPDLNLLDPFVKTGHELLIEVEYQERQPDSGVLRFPRFKGVRWDVDRSAASVEQFDRETAGTPSG